MLTPLVVPSVSVPLATHGRFYAIALGVQLGGIGLALISMAAGGRIPGINILQYYLVVTWATFVSLVRYLRRGVPATWDAAAGTRIAG